MSPLKGIGDYCERCSRPGRKKPIYEDGLCRGCWSELGPAGVRRWNDSLPVDGTVPDVIPGWMTAEGSAP